jgi:hypothetical protein
MRIVTFGNCQADALAEVLSLGLPGSGYSVEFYSNNDRTGGMRSLEEIQEGVRGADLLVFQPLDDKHGVLSEANVRSQAKSEPIAFPYLFNSGIAGFCHTGGVASRRNADSNAAHSYGNVFGERTVIARLERGMPASAVIEAYVDGRINFNLRHRFDRCVAEVKRRDQGTEIKLGEHIAENHQKTRQFLTHNHPTTALIVEICRQLKALTDLPIDIAGLQRIQDENVAGLPGGRKRCPVSPYDAKELGYEFGHDPDWIERGTAIIQMIAEGYRAERGEPQDARV